MKLEAQNSNNVGPNLSTQFRPTSEFRSFESACVELRNHCFSLLAGEEQNTNSINAGGDQRSTIAIPIPIPSLSLRDRLCLLSDNESLQFPEEELEKIGDGAADTVDSVAFGDWTSSQHPVSHRSVFPLQLLGFDVDPINSVQFSNHTGYPTFKGQVLDGKQLRDLIEGLEANGLLYYTHLLTGYIGSVSFLNAILEVVKKLRSINPGLLYVCDPVLGDQEKLYVPQELVSVYREKVVPVASMLTPNQFEAEQLTGLRIASEKDGREACNMLHAAGTVKVVITSINIDGNLFLIGSHRKGKEEAPEQFKITIPKIPAYFTGTGDLTTALLLGWSNKYPDHLEKAAELAVSSLQALLQRTLNDYTSAGFNPCTSTLEIRLIQSQDDIRNPEIKFRAEKYKLTG